MNDGLSEKLRALNDTLTPAEQTNFKVLLGLAVGGLIPGHAPPRDGNEAQAFQTVSETLASLQPYSARIPTGGLAYRGRPAFMTDDLLATLKREARSVRATAKAFEQHFLGCGGEVANELAIADALCAFVRQHAGPVEPTGIASFLFYDRAGQGIEPHIDTDVFSMNVLLMLEHTVVSDKRSALVVFPPGRPPKRLELEPGEIVLLFAGSITHGREPILPGEAVSILTFGFRPIGEG